MPKATTISNSPEETLALGEVWAAEARAGWVIGLDGDLGTLAVGKEVRIVGLRGRSDLNGTFGTVLSFNSHTGRWAVFWHGGANLLKPPNLVALDG